jgi:predicted metal-dependent HD superfamily phosphohydrolase
MLDNQSEIIQLAKQHVTDLLENHLDERYLYHNLKHTQRVVKSTKELINACGITEEEGEALLLAAWFHDTGFTVSLDNHEEMGCVLAEDFLSQQGYSAEGTALVKRLILATQRYFEPETELEKIIRDADCSHFAKKTYWETTDYLREELALLDLEYHTHEEWLDVNIAFFKKEHQYYTEYARNAWQKGKDKNLKQLLKEKKAEIEIAKKEALKAKFKSDSPDRSIQTLYRVTLKNHLKLSDIADTKANILLSVNAIIISLVLANLIPKLDNPSNTYLIYPTVIFVLFSVVSMVLSILATRPNITSGEFTHQDVKDRKVNLLFFGNFHKMSLNDYEWAITELVKDKDYVYATLTKDLYFLGKVLERKYRILRVTYNIFMVGMIVTVIAFGVAFHFFGPDRLAI